MRNVDPTVAKETKYVAIFVGILSLLMQSVFLIVQHWDVSVLLGNLLSAAVSIANFFLLGLTVQSATKKDDEKDAKLAMHASHGLRLVLLFVAALLGVLLPCFNNLAVLVPLFFPRIAFAFRPLFEKKTS